MNPYFYGFFQDLEFDVIEHWDKTGKSVYHQIVSGRDAYLSEPIVHTELKESAKAILADPNKCLVELGYQEGDFATYIADCSRRGC